MGHGGRRDPREYQTIIAEVFYDTEVSKNGVRPCKGQTFPQSMKIECSRAIRNYPIGTKIRLDVVETDKEVGHFYIAAINGITKLLRIHNKRLHRNEFRCAQFTY